MKQLKIVKGSNATILDLEQAIEIDKLIYSKKLLVPLNKCIKWFNKNPDIYTFIIDEEDHRVVAYMNAMPISEKLYAKIIGGKVSDSNISEKDIMIYEVNINNILYFCSLAIHPDYQVTKAFNMLYEDFIKEVIDLARKNIYINRIIAEGVTDKGSRICRLSGMEPIASNQFDNVLYGLYLPEQNFRPLSSSAENLKQLYKKSR